MAAAGGGALPQPRDVNSAPACAAQPAYEAQRLGADELLKRFLADISDTSRDAEVQRVLSCFKLNPYEHLGLRFDAQPEDVKRQYRKVRGARRLASRLRTRGRKLRTGGGAHAPLPRFR